ncbi:MAG: hypothetical protein EZS28_011462 [Streblomastix strix]|uniref:RRM domain-containing protein n=1 Tax=Streblomastix strix TaxID=222440 RepID=A0A5J4WDJ2_9EUKA|nr:MAG: hypothetical protein EZS28_011462 [Streblomastix strix]
MTENLPQFIVVIDGLPANFAQYKLDQIMYGNQIEQFNLQKCTNDGRQWIISEISYIDALKIRDVINATKFGDVQAIAHLEQISIHLIISQMPNNANPQELLRIFGPNTVSRIRKQNQGQITNISSFQVSFNTMQDSLNARVDIQGKIIFGQRAEVKFFIQLSPIDEQQIGRMKQIKLYQLNKQITSEYLRKYFEQQFGPVIDAKVLNSELRTSLGEGVVQFEGKQGPERLLQLLKKQNPQDLERGISWMRLDFEEGKQSIAQRQCIIAEFDINQGKRPRIVGVHIRLQKKCTQEQIANFLIGYHFTNIVLLGNTEVDVDMPADYARDCVLQNDKAHPVLGEMWITLRAQYE